MVIPTNQNRHFYVVKRFVDGSTVTSLAQAGDIEVKSIGTGNDKQIYFLYKGANGEVIKSDYIQVKNIDYVKAVDAWSMLRPLKKIQVTVPDAIVNDDYVLRIVLRQFHGMSDEDVYIKDAVVRGYEGMTKSQFYAAMKNALDLSFSREVGATKNSNPYLTFSANDVNLIIREKVQPWTLGIGKQERVYFDVIPTTVFYNGTDFEWGHVEDQTKPLYKDGTTPNVYDESTNENGIIVPDNAIPNGHEIADLEWFCLGERGDQYRMVGWPDYIPTYYQVDPSKEYHVLEIHHAFTDTGVNSYRGEKDITIVAPKASGTDTGKNAINAIIDEIESLTGLTITGLT